MSQKKYPRTPGNFRNSTTTKLSNLSTRSQSLTDLRSTSRLSNSVGGGTGDLSLELDLAYGEYLQAIARKDLVEKAVKAYDEQIDEQLATHLNILRKALAQERVLENEVIQTELEVDTNKLTLKLQAAVSQLNEVFYDNNVLENLDIYNKTAEELTNSITLVNIQPLVTQTDYDKLSFLIEANAKSIRRLKEEIKHPELYEQLCAEREKFLRNISELGNLQKSLSEVRTKIDYLLPKNISDKFATIADNYGMGN